MLSKYKPKCWHTFWTRYHESRFLYFRTLWWEPHVFKISKFISSPKRRANWGLTLRLGWITGSKKFLQFSFDYRPKILNWVKIYVFIVWDISPAKSQNSFELVNQLCFVIKTKNIKVPLWVIGRYFVTPDNFPFQNPIRFWHIFCKFNSFSSIFFD